MARTFTFEIKLPLFTIRLHSGDSETEMHRAELEARSTKGLAEALSALLVGMFSGASDGKKWQNKDNGAGPQQSTRRNPTA